MEKRLVGEARCRASEVRYYLLEENGSYGVAIEMGDETAFFSDLSPSGRRTGALAEALLRGTVTPVALRDVVDDWLLS